MEVAGSSKMSLLIQQTIWHHIPEHSNLYLKISDMLTGRVKQISANNVEPSKFFINNEDVFKTFTPSEHNHFRVKNMTT
jgi:hypothetical protein